MEGRAACLSLVYHLSALTVTQLPTCCDPGSSSEMHHCLPAPSIYRCVSLA
jgi:hypothetical protein